jgi:hypothetical protein
MSYDPRFDPFFMDEFAWTPAFPVKAPGELWPDHCKQSSHSRKFALSVQPVLDKNFVPSQGDTLDALAKSRYLEKEK